MKDVVLSVKVHIGTASSDSLAVGTLDFTRVGGEGVEPLELGFKKRKNIFESKIFIFLGKHERY
jgi:hypothetical protein